MYIFFGEMSSPLLIFFVWPKSVVEGQFLRKNGTLSPWKETREMNTAQKKSGFVTLTVK